MGNRNEHGCCEHKSLFKKKVIGKIPVSIPTLYDTDIHDLEDGQALVYNGEKEKWVNEKISGGEDLSDYCKKSEVDTAPHDGNPLPISSNAVYHALLSCFREVYVDILPAPSAATTGKLYLVPHQTSGNPVSQGGIGVGDQTQQDSGGITEGGEISDGGNHRSALRAGATSSSIQQAKDIYITVVNNGFYVWNPLGSTTADLSNYSTTEEMNLAISNSIRTVTDFLDQGYLYMGFATPNLHIGGNIEHGEFYFADEAGTYAYFLNGDNEPLVLPSGLCILYRGSADDGWNWYLLIEDYNSKINRKQDTLVSGQNIKTVNGNSILGSGNIEIGSGGGTFTQEQSNWTQTDSTQVDYIKNKPQLAAVATSGNYNDLNNKPTIPVIPQLAIVATTGNYNDLNNKPNIPTVPTNVSAFTNDAGYLTHQDISGKADKSEVTAENTRATAAETDLQNQINDILEQLSQLSGITLTVTPTGTVYAGQQATIHIAVSTTMTASSIVVKRNGTSIRTASNTNSLTFDDTPTPSAAGVITYTVEATISGNEKSATKTVTVVKQSTNIQWSPDSYEATIGAQNSFPTLTGTSGLSDSDITYKSSNPNAATINSSGVITLVAAGTTTITATYAGDSTHLGSSDNYTLTVKAAAPTIPDYYIGWATGNNSSFDGFAALTAEQLKALSTGYSKTTQPSITKTVTSADIIGNRQVLFLMWKSDSAPVSGSFYGGLVVEPLAASSFIDDNVFQIQRDVQIDGNMYHVAGMRLPFEVNNYLTANF